MTKPVNGKKLIEAIARRLPANVTGQVLVVDDDHHALTLYERLVEQELPQLAVIRAVSGAEALAQLAQGLVPVLVILDLVMPEPDGFAVLNALRAIPATSEVPVLVLSGKSLTFEEMKHLSQHDVLVHSKEVLADDELVDVLLDLVNKGMELDRQNSELVKLTLAYIHQHYARTIARSDICALLGISENYLSRLFHQEMGFTLVDYINRYRVSIARRLISESNTSIAVIAQQVGIDDPAYFSRLFTRYVGVSPRAFRQSQ